MRQIKDLDDAIDEQSDLVRELNRIEGCKRWAEQFQQILDYLEKVRENALGREDMKDLLDTK